MDYIEMLRNLQHHKKTEEHMFMFEMEFEGQHLAPGYIVSGLVPKEWGAIRKYREFLDTHEVVTKEEQKEKHQLEILKDEQVKYEGVKIPTKPL